MVNMEAAMIIDLATCACTFFLLQHVGSHPGALDGA